MGNRDLYIQHYFWKKIKVGSASYEESYFPHLIGNLIQRNEGPWKLCPESGLHDEKICQFMLWITDSHSIFRSASLENIL